MQDRDGARQLLKRCLGIYKALRLIWADGGYAGQLITWVKGHLGCLLQKDHNGNVYWVGFATKQGVRDLKPGQRLFTGVLVNDYGDNMADFEEAIRQAHDNGANGITFFTAGALKHKHLEILKKYNEAYNK